MGQIYSNALCNIAATASVDSYGGLFFDREGLEPCEIYMFADMEPERYRIIDVRCFQREIDDSPLLRVSTLPSFLR